MSELKKIGQETAKAQAKQEAKKNQPDVSGTVGLTLVWLAVIVLPFMLHADIIGWLALAVAVILLVAGIFWKPLRSGMSNALVGLVPLWGDSRTLRSRQHLLEAPQGRNLQGRG